MSTSLLLLYPVVQLAAKIVEPVMMNPAENNLASFPSVNSDEKWVKFLRSGDIRVKEAGTETLLFTSVLFVCSSKILCRH